MTTPDSKYKHKPSEKHTLEEVLKSLQDLIRNELLDKDQSAVSAEALHAASTPPTEKPGHGGIDLTPEDFAPTSPTAGPVNLDAVMRSLKDLIGNELNVGDEFVPTETAPETPASEQPPAIDSPSEESLSLDEELIAEMPEDVTIGSEAIYTEGSKARPVEQPDANETAPEEFISLEEELSHGESTEITPPPPALSTIPDHPEEISPELLGKPAVAAAPEASQPVPENEIVTGTQQELPLDVRPLSASEHGPDTINNPPQTEPELDTAPASADTAPGIISTPLAEDANKIAEETLPTIDVEETFDAGAYFETETRQPEPPPSDAQEIQEIIATALDTPPESEKLPPAPMASADGTRSINLAPISEPGKVPADKKTKLEILEEPATETHQNTASVDFDTIDVELPYKEQGPSSLTIETPAQADNAPPATVAPPARPEASPESGTQAFVPPSPEVIAETKPEPGAGAVPDSIAIPPLLGESNKLAGHTVPTESKPAFNLDDIPVLNEVVAPPAGSTLVAEPISAATGLPLPAPERARDIVVRAVAKLNVEMRRTGGAGLDTKTILRLQQLIRQELEKNGNKS